MKLRRLGIIVIIALATVVALQYLEPEATLDRCYYECELCGLSRGEVARMIQTVATSPLTRKQQIYRYLATGEPGDGKAACLPCVEAVLDAAGVE